MYVYGGLADGWNAKAMKAPEEVWMFDSISRQKWGDTEIAERGRSVLVMRAR